MSTYFPKEGEIARKWYVVDADGQTLGRLATRVASILAGKESAKYTPFLDAGDHVVVINADKVRLTGMKAESKVYHHYTGFPGGIKERSAKFILEGRFPERVVEKAVERMLPRGPLGRKQLGNLRVYKGGEHPHAAQNPTLIDVGSFNSKNVRNA
jgi:large subunit ribosomal protein L13